jgi:hypothetical protein
VVVTKTMPFANLTEMTEPERAAIGALVRERRAHRLARRVYSARFPTVDGEIG